MSGLTGGWGWCAGHSGAALQYQGRLLQLWRGSLGEQPDPVVLCGRGSVFAFVRIYVLGKKVGHACSYVHAHTQVSFMCMICTCMLVRIPTVAPQATAAQKLSSKALQHMSCCMNDKQCLNHCLTATMLIAPARHVQTSGSRVLAVLETCVLELRKLSKSVKDHGIKQHFVCLLCRSWSHWRYQ